MLKCRKALALAGVLIASTATGCGGPECTYGDAVSGTSTLHVSAECGAADGDGSKDNPFKTISAAATKATANTSIVVSKGTYGEKVTLTGGVSLIGTGPNEVKVVPPAGEVGVWVSGGDGATTISKISVDGATSVGIGGQDVNLTLVDVEVTNTAQKDGQFGNGVQVTGSTKGFSLKIESSNISSNAGAGVLAEGIESVSIIDRCYTEDPRGEAGIIDPSYKTGMTIGDNGDGGVAIIDPSYHPGTAGIIDPSYSVALDGVDVNGNAAFGIGLFGITGSVSVMGTAVHNTTAKAGTDLGGNPPSDGIVVVGAEGGTPPPIQFDVDAGSWIGNNGRAGIVASDAAATMNVEGEVAANAHGGVWGNGEGVEMNFGDTSLLCNNQLVGAWLSKGKLNMDASKIVGTLAVNYTSPAGGLAEMVGDGMEIVNEGDATVANAVFENNARAGIAAGGAKSLKVSGSKAIGGQYGAALNAGGATDVQMDLACEGDPTVSCQDENADLLLPPGPPPF